MPFPYRSEKNHLHIFFSFLGGCGNNQSILTILTKYWVFFLPMDEISFESTASKFSKMVIFRSVFELFISRRKSRLAWIAPRPNAKMVKILVAPEDLPYRKTHGVTICNLISCKLP